MIICICRRINDSSVREAIASGAREPEEVQAHFGCAFNCGKCRPAIGEIIAEEMDVHAPARDMIAAE